METPDYLTYKKSKQEYQKDNEFVNKKDVDTSKLKGLGIVFALSFILCFLIIINVTGSLNAKVDIEETHAGYDILDENAPNETKSTIDHRLTNLYNEEIGLSKARAVNREDSIIDPEKYKEIQMEQDKILKDGRNLDIQKDEEEKDEEENTPKQNKETYTPSFIRVLVGKYQSVDEAKEAQEILRKIEGFEGTSPFIRKMGDFYTIQVGSYTNPEVAKAVAVKLSKTNYNVWVLEN